VYEDNEAAMNGYSDLLVVGIAGSYNSRAQFEREVVTKLKALGVQATAFHSVVEGDILVNRDSVKQALAGRTFDAVIVTRVLDTNSESELVDPATGTKVTRKEGNPLNFFRYDYEDLDDPPSLETTTSIAFETELYAVDGEKLVWSIESNSGKFDNVGVLIDSVADKIVQRLDRDGLLAR
jgi:hypothetical protein